MERKEYFFLAAIIFLAVLLYANTLQNAFVYDDEEVVLENESIRSWRNLPLLFSPGYFRLFREGTYRPVVTFSYFLDYSLWKLNPAGYHLDNLILHALCGALLFYLLKLFGFRPATSFLAGLFFIAHPVATEAVNSISYREDLFALFFFLLAIIFYVMGAKGSRGEKGYYYLALASFLLALFSKEMAVTLPLIIILGDRCFGFESGTRKNRAAKLTGLFLALGLYVVVRFFLLANPNIVPASELRFFPRMMTMGKIVAHYLKLLVLPLGLSAEYKFRVPNSFREPGMWLSAVLLLGIIMVSFRFFRRSRAVFFGIWWLFITLIPVMNIIPLHNMAAERYLYLPGAGFSIVLAEAAHTLLLKGGKRRSFTLLGLFLLLAFWSTTVVRRNRVWRESLIFFQENLKRCPRSARFHYNLGNAYRQEKRYEEAVGEYREALRLKPDYAKPNNNLGFIYLEQGNYEAAISEFQKALEKEYDFPEAHYNLGYAYLLKTMYDEAESELNEAIRLQPGYTKAYNNLGFVYLRRKDYARAIEAYTRALEIDPGFLDARSNLGVAYFQTGEYGLAEDAWRRVLVRDPGYQPALKGLKLLEEVRRN